MFSYTAVGIILVVAGAEITNVSTALQVIGSNVLGPIMIAIGIFMFFSTRFRSGGAAN